VRGTILKLLVSLGLGALFVWLAARGVDWAAVGQVLARVDPGVSLAYLGIFTLVHIARVYRWGILLRPLGPVSFGKLFTVSSVGFMALVLLPLRLGEFARPFLIAERGRIRVSAALATIVVERVVDALAMALLLVALLFFLEGKVTVPADLAFWSWVVLGGFLTLMVFLVLAYWKQERTVALFERVFGFLPPRLRARLVSMLRAFIGGLRALPDARLVLGFLGLTLLYWTMNGLGMWVLFYAFADLRTLGLTEAFTVLAVLCVGLLIPAGPGMVGNFHYFVKLGLSLFLADAVLGSSGVAYAILAHAIQLGQQVGFGVVCLFSSQITVRHLWAAPSASLEESASGPPGG
jgi:glycosyltransferase 2 family protein